MYYNVFLILRENNATLRIMQLLYSKMCIKSEINNVSLRRLKIRDKESIYWKISVLFTTLIRDTIF